jgi:hypothetical protein
VIRVEDLPVLLLGRARAAGVCPPPVNDTFAVVVGGAGLPPPAAAPESDVQFEIEALGDSHQGVDRDVGPPVLDAREVRPRHADTPRKRLLGNVRCFSGFAKAVPDRDKRPLRSWDHLEGHAR